ncbi:MAG: DEAD/DEAH box helicase family protein [Deltaproteobacteria bacterium]|nr:DEAD/DEAH box helicase family protein [Deltaproteobacteria bacterium]MBN2671958.1 DEAD/DEAH box helicase family protein [Deltaproteobacteria bacterium]
MTIHETTESDRPHLSFNRGTLEIRGLTDETLLPATCTFDKRARCFRGPASAYADVVMTFVRGKMAYDDEARDYAILDAGLRVKREARPFQSQAIDAWNRAGGRGVVVLPTGAGKSHVALMAADAKRRSTLVVAPTLDLVRQWYDLLRMSFNEPVGVIGGGEHSVESLTVTTYDSAHLHMEHLGNRFGLIVFDECHHLPGEVYGYAARFCLAPYRLGLSATPERADGRHTELDELIGPLVYRRDIREMTGEYLAEYDVDRVTVDLSPEELAEYREARTIYRNFISSAGINMREPDGWNQFIIQSARSPQGRRAMEAYQKQRNLAFTAPSKLEYVAHLLHQHRLDKTILFTEDNATAYAISKRFLVPVITHQTKVTERSAILSGLGNGTYSAIVTSKVLNEGVDVPEANVEFIVSGSASVREHVQRLGRILRKKKDGTKAVLYELVAGSTSESFVSERRRDHNAYR